MKTNILTQTYLAELQRESKATRQCLERILPEHYNFKPHETSMEMRYMALLTAEIPQWIYYMITDGELDFATYPRFEFATTDALVSHFDDCVAKAVAVLETASDEVLEKTFTLKRDGKELYSAPLSIDIPTTLNHWVHHRGQLTVYMRMKEIKVPSLYGPSGDTKEF